MPKLYYFVRLATMENVIKNANFEAFSAWNVLGIPLSLILKMFVYHNIDCFPKKSTVDERCPRVVRTNSAVRECIRRNPLRKQEIISKEMDISTKSVSIFIRDDLHIKASRRSDHLLATCLK